MGRSESRARPRGARGRAQAAIRQRRRAWSHTTPRASRSSAARRGDRVAHCRVHPHGHAHRPHALEIASGTGCAATPQQRPGRAVRNGTITLSFMPARERRASHSPVRAAKPGGRASRGPLHPEEADRGTTGRPGPGRTGPAAPLADRMPQYPPRLAPAVLDISRRACRIDIQPRAVAQRPLDAAPLPLRDLQAVAELRVKAHDLAYADSRIWSMSRTVAPPPWTRPYP